jgi:hypothetical protein
MLEHSLLWISAPTTAWPLGVPRTGQLFCHVLAADTRETLGHVVIMPRRWRSKRANFAAHEMPDSSLLFSARWVGWFRRALAVAEADGNLVAMVYAGTVLSASRRLLARRSAVIPNAGVFIAPDGSELGRWEYDPEGTIVQFTDDVRDRPYVKMGLLAAILANR